MGNHSRGRSRSSLRIGSHRSTVKEYPSKILDSRFDESRNSSGSSDYSNRRSKRRQFRRDNPYGEFKKVKSPIAAENVRQDNRSKCGF